jgi:prevent-host-death family protein
MKFVSTRDLRNQPGLIRKLAQKEDLVLTANGKPVAVLIGVEEDDLEETTRVVRQARAQRALSRLRREAARGGIQRSPSSKIEAEIRAARSQRKS